MGKPLELRFQAKAKVAGRKPKSVEVKTVATAEGGRRRMFLIDANSDHFAEDFLWVFSRNVRAARRATRALTGRRAKGGEDR